MPNETVAKSVFAELKGNDGPHVVYDKVTLPLLESNSVLIAVRACRVGNHHDDSPSLLQILTKGKQKQRVGVGCDVAGRVLAVGAEVTTLRVGDSVVGIVPLDYEQSGCSDYVVLEEFDVAIKPDSVSYEEAAACIGDAVKAYTALHYLGRLTSGETVLILDGASPFGSICIQLAHHWGAKVITTANTEEEKLHLVQLKIENLHIVELNQKNSSLKLLVMLETGNLGVNIIIDQGIVQSKLQNHLVDVDNRLSSAKLSPTKHDIISSLAVGGRWVTSKDDLQLDPPNAQLLFLRCASLGFLFEHAWMLSCAQHGRYQHILMDVMEKAVSKIICPNVYKVVSIESALEFLKSKEPKIDERIVVAFEC